MWTIIQGDARRIPLGDETVQCVVTSPPFWGLRDYGLPPSVWGGDNHTERFQVLSRSDDQEPDYRGREHEWGKTVAIQTDRNDGDRSRLDVGSYQGGGEDKYYVGKQTAAQGQFCPCGAWLGVLGLEPTPELYIEHMVEIFREVRRVLRKDGTVWMNLGDVYNSKPASTGISYRRDRAAVVPINRNTDSLKTKDLCGIPWRVALALQADGWWLRSDIIWSKPNPMPESVTDRPTRSHEYVFLLTKAANYYYDADAVRERSAPGTIERFGNGGAPRIAGKAYHPERNDAVKQELLSGHNLRSVWNFSESYDIIPVDESTMQIMWSCTSCGGLLSEDATKITRKPVSQMQRCSGGAVEKDRAREGTSKSIQPPLFSDREGYREKKRARQIASQESIQSRLQSDTSGASRTTEGKSISSGKAPSGAIFSESQGATRNLEKTKNSSGAGDSEKVGIEASNENQGGLRSNSNTVGADKEVLPESVRVLRDNTQAVDYGSHHPTEQRRPPYCPECGSRMSLLQLEKERQDCLDTNLKTVWHIATASFPLAHFATFPQALVEPCIKAGTSEKGACAECGSPWERVVDKKFVPQPDVSLAKGIKGAFNQKPDYGNRDGMPRGSNEFTTLRWQPTCNCLQIHCEITPSLVLDPFAGSGTVGVVCLQLARSFVGIEVKTDYCDMANKRVFNSGSLLDAQN